MSDIHTIASIALETGISKEVLRKWEERYGFPAPQRDASGHRTYPAQQAVRLKLVKRLIDAGMRPSQVVPLDEQSLASLLQPKLPLAVSDDTDTAVVAALMAMLRCRDRNALTQRLRQEVRQLGLERFVLDVVCALNMAVGQTWERGEIGIRDEHMYTEVLQNLIREELSLAQQPDGLPRILMTTPPGELHTLGLLMVEAVATFHGACGISLGAQTPLEEIAHAVGDYHADIVCLCFSAAFPKRKIVPFLKTLRGMVPPVVEIWVGGAGVGALDSSPRGIRIMTALGQLGDALSKYRREHKVHTTN
ncbi:MerR family transcriptional regulator [Janthinobacterium sp. RB2R34]|uniref:MerR family transcriptional regulator n=1 Tax=Janthinobacterium sp. RB2R34 TaxID=3424193 RepID=UPI003F1F5477